MAFLPHSAVRKELRAGKLVSAVPPGRAPMEIVMDVRAYRERPSGKHAPKGSAQALWAFLAGQGESAVLQA